MPSQIVLRDILLIFTVALAVVYLFHRLRLPSIAGFLVAGALIGPYGLNLVSDVGQVHVMSEIGIVLLLFTIGIEFSLGHLAAARSVLLMAGPIQLLGGILLVLLVSTGIGVPVDQAILWGCLLSLSSTAVVLKALYDRGETESLYGRASVGTLIFQDLAALPMMLLTPLLNRAGEGTTAEVLLAVIKSVMLVALVFAAAWVVVPRLLQQIVRSRSRELFFLTIIVVCLGIAWLTSLTGLSVAIGAFIAGLVFAESEYSHQAIAEIVPFRDSFNSLFFVSIGMLMDVRVIVDHPVTVLTLAFAVLLGKSMTAGLGLWAAGLPPRAVVLGSVALAQVGEFSFILAEGGRQGAVLGQVSYQLFLAVSVLTMVFTPFLMQVAPRLARRTEALLRLRGRLPGRTMGHLERLAASAVRTKDHVVIVGYGVNGRNVARVLAETEIPYLVLELDGDTVQREAKRGTPICYGDGTNPSVLRRVRLDQARVLVLAISDPFASRRAVQAAKGINPDVRVVVRTRYLREVEELRQLGADEVVPEEFETSIEIFALVLRAYKLPGDYIVEKAEQIRRENYAMLRRTALPELAHHLRAGTLADVEVETSRIDPDSPALGKTLAQLSVRSRTGASVIALVRGGVTESNPSAKTRLEAGDVVVLLGGRDQIQRAIGLLMDKKAG